MAVMIEERGRKCLILYEGDRATITNALINIADACLKDAEMAAETPTISEAFKQSAASYKALAELIDGADEIRSLSEADED
jgi:hypothetical protein